MYYDDDDDDDDDYYYYERYYMVISMLDFYKVLRRSAVLCRFPSSLKARFTRFRVSDKVSRGYQ